MGRVTLNEDYLLATANAIRAKNGSSDTYTPAEFADAIADISGGGGSGSSSDDVKFIDYDGTVVYSYSASDFLALTELPANPTHTGLVPQGWNWTLTDAKTHVNSYGKLIIGQLYTTTSGKTEIDIYLSNDKRLSPCLCLSVNGEVDIDWGDNTTHDILTGTNINTAINTTHEYASPGNYTILINVTNGEASFYSSGSSVPFFKKDNSSGIYQYIYSNTVQAIRIGNNFKIRTYVFNNCYSLSSITFPSDAINGNTIGSCTFQNCYSLLSITLPNGVTSIGTYAFQYCYSLSLISISNTITTIGTYAFGNCYSLLSITLPNGVTSIGTYAFYNCSSLSLINLPNGITSIVNSLFQGCYSLLPINIPSGVTSIGTYAFYNCSSFLSSINLPNGVTSIGANAFYNCYSLSSITIPSGVTSIENNAFRECHSLSSINIPSGITSIRNYVFSNCYSLFSVNIPNGVTSIGNNTFYNCYSLSSITIPSGVTSMGTNAFGNCYGMKEYHLLPTIPPTLAHTNAFIGIPSDCIIYVPQGTLETYQTAENWSTYASYMQELPST